MIRGEAELKSAPTYMANTARNFGLWVCNWSIIFLIKIAILNYPGFETDSYHLLKSAVANPAARCSSLKRSQCQRAVGGLRMFWTCLKPPQNCNMLGTCGTARIRAESWHIMDPYGSSFLDSVVTVKTRFRIPSRAHFLESHHGDSPSRNHVRLMSTNVHRIAMLKYG